jgi:type III secretion protein V
MGQSTVPEIHMFDRWLDTTKRLFLPDHGRRLPTGEIALAALVVAVLVMMIVPLPPAVLDFLIALNLSVSLALLLVALCVADSSRLAALPSILLLATLFRLGLNVSTTRLVLLDGDAGRIVEAFGKIVVSGNLVVGCVVFLVLAIVQFIVIAKGAERVAEVAARFTLDALPGKQMAIDADLRAGSVTLEDAQERRRSLERESQLYGALDGAMKFIKGDAIAGLAIVAVNIVGGLGVGMLQKGMSMSEAASHYAVLTIGDGLAAQLPSLLVSATAGLVVTRVPDGDTLGGDIADQFSAQPKALLATAGLLAVLGLLPGLPALPFLVFAGLAAVAGGVRFRRSESLTTGASKSPSPGVSRAAERALTLPSGTPVRIAAGSRLAAAIAADGRAAFDAALGDIRAGIWASLGVRFPDVALETVAASPPLGFDVSVGAASCASGVIPDRERWIGASTHELAAIRIEATSDGGVVTGRDGAWSTVEAASIAEQAGLVVATQSGALARVVERAVRSNAGEFLGVQEARDLADQLEATHPALVAEVVPRLVSLAQLADVLRRLVSEQVSIRDLRGIFEALAANAPREPEPALLTERVRAHLRRQLSADATGGRPTVPVIELDPDLELAFREAARYADPTGPPPVDPNVARRIVQSVRDLASLDRDPTAQEPIVLTASEIRRHVRWLIESDAPWLRVYAPQELLPGVVPQRVGTLG